MSNDVCSQTYCVDKQVADSACTATAYLTGVKNNYEMLGLSAAVKLNDCPGSMAPENRTSSLADWSMAKGKAVGLVSTARVTHASPAGMYAHAANREWENDARMARDLSVTNTGRCEDIAKQLITRSPGKDMKASVHDNNNHNYYYYYYYIYSYRVRDLFSLIISKI